MTERTFTALQRDIAELQMIVWHQFRVSDIIDRLEKRGADIGRLNRKSSAMFGEAVELLTKILHETPAFEDAVKRRRSIMIKQALAKRAAAKKLER